MSETGGSNIEIAHHLSEHKESAQSLGHEILEIAEALVLAVVAIRQRFGLGIRQNCTAKQANFGFKLREPPHTPIGSRHIRQSGAFV
jgi:hypothetical protein